MVGTLTEFVQIVGMCEIDEINLDQGNFVQLAVSETLTIPEQKPDIEQVLKIMLKGQVTDMRLVKTPEGKATSGLEKTGDVLVIEGNLRQKVVYVAETEAGDQPVHSAEFNIPFSTFIVINTCLEAGSEEQIDVEVCIEDVFVELLNSRKIFKNVTLVVNAIVPETSPEVKIISPDNNSSFTAGSTVAIEVEAFDCECLDRVELEIKSPSNDLIEEVTEMAFAATEFLFTFSWATTNLTAGDYTINVVAYDCAEPENIATDTFTITLT